MNSFIETCDIDTRVDTVSISSNTETTATLSEEQQTLLRSIIEKGLPTVEHPYLAIANELGTSEILVIEQIRTWQKSGLIKRFGLVVKHRQLGYNANAMVVWDIPDNLVERIAAQLSSFAEVSLCYRRPRRLPDWPYNLFCMIHGTQRDTVLAQIEAIAKTLVTTTPQLNTIQKDVLFSTKAYKQQGARYGKNNMNNHTQNHNKPEQTFILNKEVPHG